MNVIAQPNPDYLAELGLNRIRKGQKRRLLKYCAEYDCDLGKALYNPMTRSLVLMSQEEYDSLFTDIENDYVSFLIRSYTLVAEDFDDMAAMQKLRNRYVIPLDDVYLQKGNIHEYTILTTTHCNANCFYCYEKGRSKVHMTEETAEKIGEFIIEHAPLDRVVDLRWFGGEPLFNMKVMDIIVNKIKETGLEYQSSLISNGSLFNDAVIKKAVDLWHLKHIQITLDGTEKVYNEAKNYTKKNFNPYKRVKENIKKLLEANISVSIRMNLELYNADDLKNLIRECHKDFGNDLPFGMYAYPIFEEGNPRTEEHKKELYDKLIEIEQVLAECNYLNGKELYGGIRATHCMVDNGKAILFAPTGDIGLCEHYSETEFFSHLDNYEEKDWDVIKDWKRVEEPLDICSDCSYFPDCLRCSKCVELHDCDPYIKEWRQREVVLGVKQEIERWWEQVCREENERNNCSCGGNCGNGSNQQGNYMYQDPQQLQIQLQIQQLQMQQLQQLQQMQLQLQQIQTQPQVIVEEPKKSKWQAFKDNWKLIFNIK